MVAELGASIYTIRKDLPVMIFDFCPHFIAVANFIWCDSFAMEISAPGQSDLGFNMPGCWQIRHCVTLYRSDTVLKIKCYILCHKGPVS